LFSDSLKGSDCGPSERAPPRDCLPGARVDTPKC
jgi:hypothetical protein